MNPNSQLRVICDNKETVGPAVITYVSTSGALVRALKTFALAFIGGLLVFPVPLVHIFGVILAFKTRGMVQGLSGSFDCSSCRAASVMEYQEGKPPYYGSCQACRNPYQVYPIPE